MEKTKRSGGYIVRFDLHELKKFVVCLCTVCQSSLHIIFILLCVNYQQTRKQRNKRAIFSLRGKKMRCNKLLLVTSVFRVTSLVLVRLASDSMNNSKITRLLSSIFITILIALAILFTFFLRLFFPFL